MKSRMLQLQKKQIFLLLAGGSQYLHNLQHRESDFLKVTHTRTHTYVLFMRALVATHVVQSWICSGAPKMAAVAILLALASSVGNGSAAHPEKEEDFLLVEIDDDVGAAGDSSAPKG